MPKGKADLVAYDGTLCPIRYGDRDFAEPQVEFGADAEIEIRKKEAAN
jgi:hypothetical protein